MSDLIGQSIGQYQITEQIGQGGMATVYKAYQPGLDRYVAFKVLPEYYLHDGTFLARFQREAKVIAKLSHPNILPIYDFGQVGNLTYIVMQYIDGGTLRSVMGQAMPLSQVVYFIDQIAEALDYAHRRGILHRDVKPGNILLEEGQRVLLTDFGLAKMVEGTVQLTGSGVGVGTPAYMSPEQGQGQGVDARTDIYALGIILYEMVTGRVPYKADTPMAIVIKHMTAPLPMPRTINPNLPEAVERVILKSLAKNKDYRYPDALQMAAALKQAVAEMLDTLGPTVPVGHPSSASSMSPSSTVVDVQQSPTPSSGSHPAAPMRQTPLPSVTAPRSNNILLWILGGGALLLIVLLLAALVGFFIFAPGEAEIPLPDQAEQAKPLESVIAEAQATQGTPEQPDTSTTISAPEKDEPTQLPATVDVSATRQAEQTATAQAEATGQAAEAVVEAGLTATAEAFSSEMAKVQQTATAQAAGSATAQAKQAGGTATIQAKQAGETATAQAGQDAKAHYDNGKVLFEQGDYEQAIVEFTQAIEMGYEPAAEAYAFRGIAYAENDDNERAMADCSQALELDPQEARGYNCRGEVYFYKEDYERAMADFSKAIELEPQEVLAYYNRGNTYAWKGDYERAIADYNKAIELDPQYANAYFGRGVSYSWKGDYDQAITNYNKALELDPQNAEAYNYRGHAHFYKEKYEQAIADYSKVIELEPQNAWGYRNRGTAYDYKGDYERAITDFGKAIELDPQFTSAYVGRGNSYSGKGNHDQAIVDYNKALELDPQDALVYHNRGRSYYEKGESQKALADFQNCLSLDPPDYLRERAEEMIRKLQ